MLLIQIKDVCHEQRWNYGDGVDGARTGMWL